MEPTAGAVEALRHAWGWLVPESYNPVLISALGDAFLESEAGETYWLNTGTGELSRIANSAAEFRRLLATDAGKSWLLPALVAELRNSGKVLSPGRCYTYAILPIFAEGKYEIWNFSPVPTEEHLSLTGETHEKLASLPDGSRVKVQVV